MLKVSESTLRRWIESGKVPAYRLGERRILLKEAELEQLLTPARRKQEKEDTMRTTESATNFEQWGIKPLTEEEKQKALQVVEEAKRLQKELLAKYGPFENSSDVLRGLREERTRQLDDLH